MAWAYGEWSAPCAELRKDEIWPGNMACPYGDALRIMNAGDLYRAWG